MCARLGPLFKSIWYILSEGIRRTRESSLRLISSSRSFRKTSSQCGESAFFFSEATRLIFRFVLQWKNVLRSTPLSTFIKYRSRFSRRLLARALRGIDEQVFLGDGVVSGYSCNYLGQGRIERPRNSSSDRASRSKTPCWRTGFGIPIPEACQESCVSLAYFYFA